MTPGQVRLARLTRFYGLDMTVLANENPTYFRALDNAYSRLDAEEYRHAFLAARSIWLDRWDINRILNELDRIIHPDPPPRVQVIEHDPQKAAEYLKRLGAKVITD